MTASVCKSVHVNVFSQTVTQNSLCNCLCFCGFIDSFVDCACFEWQMKQPAKQTTGACGALFCVSLCIKAFTLKVTQNGAIICTALSVFPRNFTSSAQCAEINLNLRGTQQRNNPGRFPTSGVHLFTTSYSAALQTKPAAQLLWRPLPGSR